MLKASISSLLFLWIALPTVMNADNVRSALEIISKEGQLIIADGSSTYTFRKDGSFVSMPLGISGRTIEGKWKSLSPASPSDLTTQIVVEGKWSWINGIAPNNDFRVMKLSIWPLSGGEKVGDMRPFHDPNAKSYKCYFLIDELKKNRD